MFSIYFILSVIGAISNVNGLLPGTTVPGVLTVFGTVDFDDNNQCTWKNSEPIINNAIFPFGNFAAVDTSYFEDAVSCGECYELECVNKREGWGGCECIANAKVTVMIVDFGHDKFGVQDTIFDLPATVAIGNIVSGNCAADGSTYGITFRQVCCDHLQNIKISNHEKIDDYWLSFIVHEVRGYGSITNFFMKEPGRSLWYECERDSNGMNNNWVCDPWTKDYELYKQQGLDDNLGPFEAEPPYDTPISIKIINSNGEELISQNVITDIIPDQIFDFGANYNANCQGEPDTTTTTTTTTTTSTSTTTTTTTTTPPPPPAPATTPPPPPPPATTPPPPPNTTPPPPPPPPVTTTTTTTTTTKPPLEDKCEAYGRGFRQPHHCQCLNVKECDIYSKYCNSIEGVAQALNEKLPGDDACVDPNQRCCCSCKNCKGYLPFDQVF